MHLPNAHNAVVPKEKIVDYLLNPMHPDGAGKAAFFLALGFSVVNWSVFADALTSLANDSVNVTPSHSPFGEKFVVDGELITPCGKMPFVRTVWIVDVGEEILRLVTAYPYEPRDEDV